MTGSNRKTAPGSQSSLLSLDRFAELVDAYGAKPERWPEAERPGALALLNDSAQARALREQAAALDTLLDQAVVPATSPALADRILAMAPSPAPLSSARKQGLAGRIRHWLRLELPEAADWRGAAALAASLLVGVALGYLTPLTDGAGGWTAAEQQTVDAFAFGTLDPEDPS